MDSKVLLKADNIVKSFGATKALKGVSLTLHAGEVMALIGENGSGKSTLSSAITGSQKADSGSLEFKGAAFHPISILDSRSKGIGILVQETGTINGMTVSENLFLGAEGQFKKLGIINRSAMKKAARGALKQIGMEEIEPEQLVDSISFENRKLIEVARTIYNNPEILIVDETTTALSQNGREIIYALIQKMKEEKKAVIFISHDLEEVQRVCDTATILRDGSFITKLHGDEVTPDNMRKNMIGRDLSGHYYREDEKGSWDKEVTLKVENVTAGFIEDISFELHKGEILGLGGLTECGMHELCKVIYGAVKPEKGKITIVKSGKEIKNTSEALSQKMAYLPKDRDQESLFLTTSIKDNIAVASLDDMKKGFYISKKSEKNLANDISEKLSIKMKDIEQQVKELSGGNKQKVVVAKWLANNSEILLMDCPTRGIDVGVKAAIYKLMEDLKKEGKSIVMISEEMPELIGMSDRILVMKDGKISGEFLREEVDEQMLIQKII